MTPSVSSQIQEDAKNWAKEVLGEEVDHVVSTSSYDDSTSIRLCSINGKQVLLIYDSKTGKRVRPILIPELYLTSSDEFLRKLMRDKFGLNPINK